MVAIGVMDASMIVIDFFLFLYFALDVVTAVCATTAHKFTEKNFKINIIATLIRIALFVPLLIAGLINNASPAVFGMFVLPVINALYLTLTIKVNSIVKSNGEDNIEEYIKIQGKPKKFNSDKKRKSPTTEPPTRYSLVKDVAKVFASWKNSNNEDCYVYVMPSKYYDGVFILEMSVKKRYRELNFSKNYIDNYDYDFFKKEFDELIHKIDSDISFSTDSMAKEVWEYLKHEFEIFDGEVSPLYQERFYKELTIDGNLQLSHGDAELYELSVGQSLNKSAVYWCVTWKGGISHADGAERTVIIDDETAKNLTVEVLIEWMKKDLSNIFDLCTPSKYLENDELRDWCKRQSEKAKSKKRSEIIDGPINGYDFEKNIHLGHWNENFNREDVCLVFENPDWYLEWESWWEVHRGACNGGLTKHKVDKEYLTSHNIFSVDDFFDYIYKGNLASCREQIQSKKEVISFLSDLIKSINSPDNNS